VGLVYCAEDYLYSSVADYPGKKEILDGCRCHSRLGKSKKPGRKELMKLATLFGIKKSKNNHRTGKGGNRQLGRNCQRI